MTTAQLGPEQRQTALERMGSDSFDVLVVGGGVTGTGIALDAATRGLEVALVEARDYAAGTSSRSSKLIHGGLRYLEQRNFGLVREALRERALILHRICPHLASPVPFLFPLHQHGWERAYIGSGVLLYDTMGGLTPAVPRHRHLTRRGALRLAPALRKDALVGAIQYYDGQIDDARHTATLARTAAHYGASLATSARVFEFLREGERVVGARVRDIETGAEHDVRARATIVAAGVFTDELTRLVGGDPPFRVRASKGIHFLVARDRIRSDTGLILRTEKSVLFVIPWGRHWIVGTTDTDWEFDRAHPAATRADIDYLLEHVNAVLRDPLTTADIEGVYTGLRPLIASADAASTAALSREHAVADMVPGLTLIAGGKYTTYRVMAEDAVDHATRDFPERVPPSVTAETPLIGAEGFRALQNRRAALAQRYALEPQRVDHLLHRYGSAVDEVMALVEGAPDLARPIDGADEYLRVEARFAASHEGALHLEDVLARRTRISIETEDRGLAAAEPVARLIAPVLGWDEEQIAREVELYRELIAAERAAQQQATDREADAVQVGVPDVRMTLAAD